MGLTQEINPRKHNDRNRCSHTQYKLDMGLVGGELMEQTNSPPTQGSHMAEPTTYQFLFLFLFLILQPQQNHKGS